MSKLTDGVYGEEIVTEHTPAPTTSHRSGLTDEDTTASRSPQVVRRTSAALVAAGVLAQIAYPLLAGDALHIATVLSVLLLSGACVLHGGAAWGGRGAAGLLAIAGGIGFVAETIGVHTGFPFGAYSYSDSLGPQLAGVPVIVPLAWTMLAYPCLLLGRRLAQRGRAAGSWWITMLTGGIGLAGWDLFLDPQMVAQGHWSWANPSPALPGVPGIPLTNYAGWLLVSMLMIAVMDRALPTGSPGGELTPATVLAWTWLGSTVGNLAFFGRPWVALYGGLVMGVVTLPYLVHEFGPSRIEPPRHPPDNSEVDSFDAENLDADGLEANSHGRWT